MPFAFEDSPKGHERLNGFLAGNSFITGYQPSADDVKIFEAFKNAPITKNAHILRWYNNIASYTPEERSNFGKTAPASGNACPMPVKAPAAAKPAAKDDDDDVDLFASDNEEESKEAIAIREKRLKDYADKKSKKPALIAKSSIVLDVKPWDDETDMKEMEKMVRAIQMDGLVWGASKFVPVGYGINKLQIICIVEDDKVSIDLLTETIEQCEDLVQSVDIAAFNKI